MKKRYKIGKEARKELLAGAKIVYDLVSATSGPKGRNIAYARPWGLPRIINDGIEIAREVGSENDFENVGIDLLRESAANTVTDAGDGTTTSIIIAYHILKKSIEAIDRKEKPANPMVLRHQIMEGLHYLLKDIAKLSTKISTEEELQKVALISASYDEEIAKELAKVRFEMGTDGIVTIEKGNGTKITSEITKGMQLNKGYADPRFVTDDMRMEAVIVDPAIIVVEKTLTSQFEIAPIMEETAKRTKNVVIFGDVRGDALAAALVNKMRGTFQLLIVNPPGYGEQRLAVLSDIAIATGAKVITAQTKEYFYTDAGSATHVSANKTTTTITNGGGDKSLLQTRIEEIRDAQAKGKLSLYEREKLEERLGKLTKGVSLVSVGAKTETLQTEKYEKAKDASGSTKAALEEGVVVGGGMAFLKLAEKLEKKGNLNEGEQLLYQVLLEPTKKLLLNAGKEQIQIDSIMKSLLVAKKNEGFNINSDKVEDLWESGVIEPVRVIRLALENGVVVGTSMLTAEGVIIDAPQKQQQ